MPDGHCWEIKGGMDFQAALASLYYDGQRSLLAADQRWRDDHNVELTGAGTASVLNAKLGAEQ